MPVNIFAAADTSDLLQPLLNLPVEAMLLPVLWRLTVIVLTARAFALLFRKIGQPSVVGEIAAGLVLGPSVLGWLWPEAFNLIFKPTLSGVDPNLYQTIIDYIFRTFAGLGLILLLFLIGLKSDSSHFRLKGKSAVMISVSGVLVPFVLGLGLALLIHAKLEADSSTSAPVDVRGFALFMGVAMSITALPVLSRIMVELDLLRTRLGTMTIACAAFDDVIGWILLATVTGLVKGHFEFLNVLRMVVLTILFVALMLLLGRPIFTRWAQAIMRRNEGELSFNHLALLLAGVMLCAIATNLIGIFALFGAFFLGVAMSDQREFCDAVYKRVSDLVLVLFLPIFFTYTGLRTDISSLHSWQLWAICAAVLLVAIAGKFGGCGLAAWWSGLPARESACVGVLMNTRGLMELIVINIGYRLQVIPTSVYCMLVIMAMVTTMMTTPILVRLIRGTNAERELKQSAFFQAGASASAASKVAT